MILVDTSAWVEFLRDGAVDVADAVEQILQDDRAATTGPVVMEVLAGARSAQHLRQLQGLLARATLLPSAPEDFTDAALMYRMCRINGRTIRSMVDCLIAAVAVRADVAVLHADRDFDMLETHTPLRVYRHDAGPAHP